MANVNESEHAFNSFVRLVLQKRTRWIVQPNVVGIDIEILDRTPVMLVFLLNAPNRFGEGLPRIPRSVDISNEFRAVFGDLDLVELDDLQVVIHNRPLPIKPIVVGRIVDAAMGQRSAAPLFLTKTALPSRPSPGGVYVTAKYKPGGTLGVNTDYRGAFRLISANHAIVENTSTAIGQIIYQPAAVDPPNALTNIENFVPIVDYSSNFEADQAELAGTLVLNEFDVAWGTPAGSECSPNIRLIDPPATVPPKQIRLPSVTDDVMIVGGSMSVPAMASIASTNFLYRSISRYSRISCWQRGIRLDEYVTAPGDSGAALVAKSDGQVLGLHRAKVEDDLGNPFSVGAPLI